MLTRLEPAYFREDDCILSDFAALCASELSASDAPHASEITRNLPVYDACALKDDLSGSARGALLSEWNRLLGQGPGVVAIRGAVAPEVCDTVSKVFRNIIAGEGAGGGDHFAAAGKNDRIWNAHQKLCLTAPGAYAAYTASPVIAAVAEAWLGPGYQVTAQVNLVHPGGAAQSAHRDFHLGFTDAKGAARFPATAHRLSPALTLQGAIAHCVMPVESGPTKLLPFSQTYGPGYLAFHRPEFKAFFEERYVQLELQKGDAVFFNPALFHAGGENRTTDIHRMANLLQISSPMGRAMETLDRDAMCRAVFPFLKAYSGAERDAIITATAEGYAFPTNLDCDPPIGGLAPKTQADILAASNSAAELARELDALKDRQRP